jgi:hypothetical protein
MFASEYDWRHRVNELSSEMLVLRQPTAYASVTGVTAVT